MYFTLTQFQYVGLAIFGGLLLIAIIAIAVWSYRLNLQSQEGENADSPESPEIGPDEDSVEFQDGFREGHKPMPLILVLIIAFFIIWGLGYTLAHAFGVFYAQ
jgi:hypothetical protein